MNELKGDKEYKDKRIRLEQFVVGEVGKDIVGRPYILMGDITDGVMCFFLKSESDKLAELFPGKQVTVIGTCTGKSISIVNMKDCVLE